mgnify:CR=1 FL=1
MVLFAIVQFGIDHLGEDGLDVILCSDPAIDPSFDKFTGLNLGAPTDEENERLARLVQQHVVEAYRDYGYDMDNTDTPLEAGLGFAVDFAKPGGFIGKEALLGQKEEGVLTHRLVQFLLEDPEPLLYGGEPIYRDGELVGYLNSGGYGHTLGGAVGLGSVENEQGVTAGFIRNGSYELEVAGARHPAKASLQPLYDPGGERVRS